jgi:hypothetical protein
MRKALTNKTMGPLAVVVTGYAVLDDVAAHQEGTISTERLGFRTIGNLAPWGIAAFSPWGEWQWVLVFQLQSIFIMKHPKG